MSRQASAQKKKVVYKVKKQNNAGAVASNAGDDFHLIWAGKKLLEILKPNSKLTAISVEGPTWVDSIEIEDEQKLYSIDLAEYYGGINFEQSKNVIFSQLKYSAYQSDKPWTASGLCTKTSQTKDNSIIYRLADTYSGFNTKFGDVSEKLILKLVSNRKLHKDFQEHISECKNLIKEYKYKRTGDLLKVVSDECKIDIEKLYKTSRLTSTLFIKFLLVLNFDDCGINIRSIHRAEIIQQLGKWSTGNLRSKYVSLINHIREMMMPESSLGFPMDRDYILAALDASSDELFPAPSKIEDLRNEYIKRDLKNTIDDCVQDCKKNIICIQATAGIGKTTFVSHIKELLPNNSISILYDCYGGGAFLQESERRHLIEVAITQICNSLAVECGTEWFIGKPTHAYEYWRQLKQRLESALFYARQQNPDAIVAIIIDAADNAMIASDLFNEECFLKGLLREILPEGVFLIITTRTERAYLIPFNDNPITIDLPAFNLMESSRHIRGKFNNSNDLECEEIHLLTDGNPRMQSYLLSEASSLTDILFQIKPDGKTMESLFKGFVSAVKEQYENMIDVDVLFTALINLPRPIPIVTFCELFSLSQDTILSISVECHQGFYLNNTNILLKDEDFETYLRTYHNDNIMAIQKIANYMYDNRTTSSYCARYAHIFIDKANNFERLIQIALDDKISDTNIGVVQLNQIMKYRIQFALKRSEMKSSPNQLLACKLVYRLIDYNAKEDALNEFLRNAPNESVLYCDEISVYNVFHTEAHDFDNLARSALVFSYLPFYHSDARQYINSYLANVNIYFNKDESERKHHSRPTTANIVEIAEAMLRLDETEEAVNWLCCWKPKKVITKHVYRIFLKLLKYENFDLCHSLLIHKWSNPNKLAIVCAYISLGTEPPITLVEELLKQFSKIDNISDVHFNYEQLILFTEYILRIDSVASARKLLDKFSLNTKFSMVPSLTIEEEKQELLYSLRYQALKHICNEEQIKSSDLWENKEQVASKQNTENRKSFERMVDFLYSLYLLRLKCIQNGNDLLSLSNKMLSELEQSSWSFHTYEKRQLLEVGLLIFVEAILYANFSQKEFEGLVRKALNILNTSPQYKTKLLEKLVCNRNAYAAALVILKEIDYNYEKEPASAREMSEVYLRCAQICRSIQPEFGLKYFTKAIETTKGLDYEAYRKLYLYRTLADKFVMTDIDNTELAFKIIRLCEDFCRVMGDEKNFPYEESIETATILSPKSIWGSLCRLDDRDKYNGFSLQETTSIVLPILLNTNKISVEEFASLISILLPDSSSEYNCLVDILLEKISKEKPSRQKPILEILINDVLYNIPMDEKKYRSKRIVDYLESNPLSPDLGIDKIKAMQSFLQQIQDKNHSKFTSNNNENRVDIKQFLSEIDISSKEILRDRLHLLSKLDKGLFVTEWLENILPDQYVVSLTWLLEIIANDFYIYECNKMLINIASFIDSIKEWPSIEKWRNDVSIQKYYIELFGKNLLRLYGEDESIFELLITIFPASTQVQYEVFLNYVINHTELNDEQLVKVICRMSDSLSLNEATELLNWSTDNEMIHLHPASGDRIEYGREITKKENNRYSVECFIWRLLGHKDKGIRCKAAHVLLRASKLENLELITSISQFYHVQIPKSYMDEENYFFLESARVWYLSTCLRIAKDKSKSLLSMYSFFKSIACSEHVVHALQRRLARDICLLLSPHYDIEGKTQLDACDKCMVSKNKKNTRKYQRENAEDSKKWIFEFDTMDTLRYWYDDVAEIFGCSENDVANDCDYFIAQFEITNERCRKWNERFLNQQDYSKSYNGHGAIPTVETLDKYAEWHAMFYVADRYRQTRNAVANDYKTYDWWLKGYLPGIDGLWCFEFRNHVPLLTFLWDFTKTVENEPSLHYEIPNNLPKEMIEHPLGISLDMRYSAHFQQSNRYIRIKSAFVDKENIHKIVNEFNKPRTEFFDFYYDSESDSIQSECYLYPTCSDITSFPEYALDKKDLLLKDYLTVSNYLMGLSQTFQESFNLSRSEQILHTRVCNDQTIPVQTYHWSEPEDESGYEKHSTYGNMVSIKKHCLLEKLRVKNQAILFEVLISFEDEDYRFYGTPSIGIKKKYIYAIDPDEDENLVLLLEKELDNE